MNNKKKEKLMKIYPQNKEQTLRRSSEIFYYYNVFCSFKKQPHPWWCYAQSVLYIIIIQIS